MMYLFLFILFSLHFSLPEAVMIHTLLEKTLLQFFGGVKDWTKVLGDQHVRREKSRMKAEEVMTSTSTSIECNKASFSRQQSNCWSLSPYFLASFFSIPMLLYNFQKSCTQVKNTHLKVKNTLCPLFGIERRQNNARSLCRLAFLRWYILDFFWDNYPPVPFALRILSCSSPRLSILTTEILGLACRKPFSCHFFRSFSSDWFHHTRLFLSLEFLFRFEIHSLFDFWCLKQTDHPF